MIQPKGLNHICLGLGASKRERSQIGRNKVCGHFRDREVLSGEEACWLSPGTSYFVRRPMTVAMTPRSRASPGTRWVLFRLNSAATRGVVRADGGTSTR